MTTWSQVFDACVDLLTLMAALLDPIWPGGMDYVKINVILFCILLPAVLLVSLAANVWMWRRLRNQKK